MMGEASGKSRITSIMTQLFAGSDICILCKSCVRQFARYRGFGYGWDGEDRDQGIR